MYINPAEQLFDFYKLKIPLQQQKSKYKFDSFYTNLALKKQGFFIAKKLIFNTHKTNRKPLLRFNLNKF